MLYGGNGARIARNLKRAAPRPGSRGRRRTSGAGEPERILAVDLVTSRSRFTRSRASARRGTSPVTLLVAVLVAAAILVAIYAAIRI
jgi:hypothetical protein